MHAQYGPTYLRIYVVQFGPNENWTSIHALQGREILSIFFPLYFLFCGTGDLLYLRSTILACMVSAPFIRPLYTASRDGDAQYRCNGNTDLSLGELKRRWMFEIPDTCFGSVIDHPYYSSIYIFVLYPGLLYFPQALNSVSYPSTRPKNYQSKSYFSKFYTTPNVYTRIVAY